MAKPRLKVYRAQMGFAESVVAAPSQKAALQAWGARQNLFAEGLADVTDAADAVAAALAKPGVVLQRPIGAATAFGEQLSGVPRPSKPPAASTHGATPPKPAPPPPKPDRSALNEAEAAFEQLEAQSKVARTDLARRRKALDAEAAALDREAEQARRAAQRRVDEARRTFEKG